MIRLSANLSKKVPLPGVDYSSQQYGASLEIEVSDADKPEAIQDRIRELYSLLNGAINEQIGVANVSSALPAAAPAQRNFNGNGNGHALPPPPQQPVPQPVLPRNGYINGRNRVVGAAANGNGTTRPVTCTESQAKCIYAICKAQGLDLASILADFNVVSPRDLAIRDASRLIDELKSRQASGQ